LGIRQGPHETRDCSRDINPTNGRIRQKAGWECRGMAGVRQTDRRPLIVPVADLLLFLMEIFSPSGLSLFDAYLIAKSAI
jgi:hypothetical protein